jgi:hypothetical protein
MPFDRKEFEVKDGRKVTLGTNAFGTVYAVAGGKPMPVCDCAGFAPFGFGYRRCAGEQLTIQVFEDFLRKVWKDKIEFVQPADRTHDGDRRQCRLFAINLRPRKSWDRIESRRVSRRAASLGAKAVSPPQGPDARAEVAAPTGEGHAPPYNHP